MDETSQNNPSRGEVPESEPGGELYALGALSPAEREAFEARLAAGEVSPEELEDHLRTITELAEEIASVMPAPRRALKDSIMSAIAPAEPEQPAREQLFVLSNEGEWQELAPGIQIKILFQSENEPRTTLLVRLAPGAVYPAHRHMGTEECLVLEGDLQVDGTSLHAGDFTVSFQDKIHIDTHSNDGCLLLISSPLNDDFLEG